MRKRREKNERNEQIKDFVEVIRRQERDNFGGQYKTSTLDLRNKDFKQLNTIHKGEY